MNSDWDNLYIKIDCLDETKTIRLEYSFIRGRLEGMIGQKPLEKLNSSTQNTISAPKMESDDDNLNMKGFPLGDVKLFMLKTLSLCILPKSGVNTLLALDKPRRPVL